MTSSDSEHDPWHKRWEQGKLGFHQSRYNTRLEKHWPDLGVDKDGAVLVPLCGKSLDMLWLHERGHPVVGVEISEIAARAFFSENQLTYELRQSGNLQEFTGTGVAAGIRLLVGDYFALNTSVTGPLSGFYDRASLIALPPEIRQPYIDKLAELVPKNGVGLLITVIYDPTKMSGPPFSVPDDEIQNGFSGQFTLSHLEQSAGPERLGSLSERGLNTMEEIVYRLVRS